MANAGMLNRVRKRVVRTVADAMWERDALQMRVIDQLLSAVEPPRRRARKPRRRLRKKG